MVPSKIDSSKSIDINKKQNINNIPFPNPIDKEIPKDQNQIQDSYTINQLKEIHDIHEQHINNYKKGNVCELVYSEEDYKDNNKFISYDKLVELVNIKEPYDKNNYKNFKYLNYNPNNELLFTSNFESGNLRYAIKLNSNEYDLILRPETDCMRTYHWFFFRVHINELSTSNKLKENKIIKFNIINFYKKTVLFNEKIRILCYYNNGWSRDTFNIHYFINGIPFQIEWNKDSKDNNNKDSNVKECIIDMNNIRYLESFESSLKSVNNININTNNNATPINYINNSSNNDNNQEAMKYHTLSFSFDFDKITTNDKYIYFAYCYPYSFTQLDSYLSSLNHYKDILRFDEIGKSKEGNSIHMLIITNFTDSFDELANKKAIIFTARVHPGESNGSYVIQGVIEFLLSNDPAAKNLRKNFIFKIVPMLNPDGVIRGNFRMNILGKDLNRMWDEPNENICPSIYNTIKMIQKTLDSRDIYFFCDFHGHSNKHNFFLYSCKCKYDYLQLDEFTIIPNPQKFKLTFYELVFQFILNKENPLLDRFSCTNKIIPSKTKTSRAILKTKYNVDFSYCLETSIAAMKTKDGTVIPYTINQYKKIGKDFCVSLDKLIEPKIFFSVLSTIRFSKNEKCSLYSKTKAKGKFIVLPYIKNSNNITNLDSSNKYNKMKENKKSTYNNKKSNNNKINNYFHKTNKKMTNNSTNNKGFGLSNKSSEISNSSTKDSSKNQSFKYNNNKLRRSFEITKYS
jgi:hypothetical protein